MDLNPYHADEFEQSLINKIFTFILVLQQAALQLKMNHWQTISFSEHKSTDAFVKVLHKYSDAIAESAMGEFERPKINSSHINVTDISITSTRWVLDTVRQKTNDIIAELRVSGNEGLLTLAGDFDAEFKKAIYLSTLK